MSERKPLTEEATWQKLQELYNTTRNKMNLRAMFAEDSNRFSKYSHRLQTPDGELLFDFSKNLINEEILKSLIQLVNSILF